MDAPAGDPLGRLLRRAIAATVDDPPLRRWFEMLLNGDSAAQEREAADEEAGHE